MCPQRLKGMCSAENLKRTLAIPKLSQLGSIRQNIPMSELLILAVPRDEHLSKIDRVFIYLAALSSFAFYFQGCLAEREAHQCCSPLQAPPLRTTCRNRCDDSDYTSICSSVASIFAGAADVWLNCFPCSKSRHDQDCQLSVSSVEALLGQFGELAMLCVIGDVVQKLAGSIIAQSKL